MNIFQPSLQTRLISTLTLISLVFALIAGSVSFWGIYQETHEFQDDLLKQTATYINPATPLAQLPDIGNEARIHVDYPLFPNDDALPIDSLGSGFHSITHDGDHYRVYIRTTDKGRIVVWQENEYREELAARAAWSGIVPLLLLIPMMGLAIIWIVRRTLSPIQKLSHSLSTRQHHDLTPLSEEHLPKEILGFVQAINRMLTRIDHVFKQQQRFIADAAHELRTPMTALSIQAERLNQQDLPPALQAPFHSLQQGIYRNRHLLEQLLCHARAQAPEQQRPHILLNTQTIFRNVIESLLPLAIAKNQDLGVSSTDNPAFFANETDVFTLIKTLCDNAIRYTPENGRIDLSAWETEHHVVFSVEDNGKGIPTHERTSVFEPFYRILGNDEEGTGLGLAIAQTIAQRYGGYITLNDSIHFEQGLWVCVYLAKSQLA